MRRNDFLLGIETVSVFTQTMLVAEERKFMPVKREISNGNGNTDVYTDHSAVGMKKFLNERRPAFVLFR